MTHSVANTNVAGRNPAHGLTRPSAAPAALAADKNRIIASAIGDLRRELEGMAEAVGRTRQEIASIKPSVEGDNRVSEATAEIAMAISSTEQAATEIMNVAERLLQIGSELREQGTAATTCDEIENHATNLMLACSFQDLTGQRMTKASNTLRYIEQRVNGLIKIWGVTDRDVGQEEINDTDPHLNGPAKDGDAISQDDIDRLIAGSETAEPSAPPAPAMHISSNGELT